MVLWPKVGFKSDYPNMRRGNWDSYGETGEDFDTKTGAQMVAIRKMIEAISGIQMDHDAPMNSSQAGTATSPSFFTV